MRVRGTVVVGRRLGRQLGFPTANVRLGEDPPAFGVYAGRVLGHPAAVSVGVRPTIDAGLEPLAEAHLLDFCGDLYGQTIEIELLSRLRPEQRFASLEALTQQIERDVQLVREATERCSRAVGG